MGLFDRISYWLNMPLWGRDRQVYKNIHYLAETNLLPIIMAEDLTVEEKRNLIWVQLQANKIHDALIAKPRTHKEIARDLEERERMLDERERELQERENELEERDLEGDDEMSAPNRW